MSERDDEFYTGYLPEAPTGVARRVRQAVVLIFALAAAAALAMVFAQRGFSSAVFEYGVVRDFAGVVHEEPHPTLEVDPPGRRDGARSRFYLVAPGKHGAGGLVAGLDGGWVRLRGSLIYRGDQTMIEVVPGSVVPDAEAATDSGAAGSSLAGPTLGVHTLTGRILDAKCYLGVMKPGSGKPHRACASLCIRGGVPPIFVLADAGGPAAYLMLVGADGRAVNAEVLAMVDEPLEITGEVVREGDLLVLKADPDTYRRL